MCPAAGHDFEKTIYPVARISTKNQAAVYKTATVDETVYHRTFLGKSSCVYRLSLFPEVTEGLIVR